MVRPFTHRDRFIVRFSSIVATAVLANSADAGLHFLFLNTQNLSAPVAAQDIAAGDLNHDSYPDVIVASRSQSRGFYVYKGTPFGLQGYYYQVVDPAAPSSHEGESVLLADFNNDGNLDAVFGRDQAGVTISPGNGDATFALGIPVLTGIDVNDQFFLWPLRLAAFHLDDDSDLDLVVENGRVGQLYVLRNDGNFVFTLTQTFDLWGTTQLATGDLNGDGADEIVWTYEDGIQVAMNDGNGTIGPPEFVQVLYEETEIGYQFWDIILVDIDLDGDKDIVGTVPNSPSPYLAILTNDGVGAIKGSVLIEVPIFACVDVAAADFDGDQRVDLAVLEAFGTLYLVRNTTTIPGEFEFEVESHFGELGINTLQMEIVSVDGDCEFDVVVLSKNARKVRVFKNLSPQHCQCTLADLNYSGVVDGEDLALLLSDWGETVSTADLNQSGRVDAWDLATLLWGWQQPVP